MILLEPLKWIWNKTPWWFKFPVILIMAPIALVVTLLWYVIFLPWQMNQIEATVLTQNNLRDLKYESLVTTQNIINYQTNESLKRIDERQTLMLTYIMRFKK